MLFALLGVSVFGKVLVVLFSHCKGHCTDEDKMPPLGSFLSRGFKIYQVFGANTDVGKTIFSTVLCRAFAAREKKDKVWYLKPVSTGAEDDADIKYVCIPFNIYALVVSQ